MTDHIKLLEEGFAPLVARVKEFVFSPKNIHSKTELSSIISSIEQLPKYTSEELSTFMEELKQLPKQTENEFLSLIEEYKVTPKRDDSLIRAELKALKHQPKRSRKDIISLALHLDNFPNPSSDNLTALLNYIKFFQKKMESEVDVIIQNIKQLPTSDKQIDSLLTLIEEKNLSEQAAVGLTNFIKRTVLMKQLYFTEGLKHLERESQGQLIALTNIIKKRIPNCSMIVLFGSYARGTEVIYDVTVEENGLVTSYQSDFDIMIVLPNPSTKANALAIEGRMYSKVETEYNRIFAGKLHAPPQFVVECESLLCENLDKQQPFFTDILKDGICLYNDGRVTLPEPKAMLYSIKRDLAQENFDHGIYQADAFLDKGYYDFQKKRCELASFELHQACERYYRNISMVFINYHPKIHDLEKLIDRTKSFSTELLSVFPQDTDFEKSTFKLLRDAYIDARYNLKFVVTKKELEYMLERTEALKEISYRICKEQIEYYDMMAKNE